MITVKLNKDIISAMKSKEVQLLQVLKNIKNVVSNHRINNQLSEITDDVVIAVIKKYIDQVKKSATMYKDSGRQDLLDADLYEISICESYVPQNLDYDTLYNIISEYIKSTGLTTKRDIGNVMKYLNSTYTGKIDRKDAGKISNELLN